MRIAHSLFFLATVATTLSAQRPRILRTSPVVRDESSILQTVTIDIAAAFQQRYRASTEALVFGRFSVGLSGEYTTQHDDQNIYYPTPVYDCPIERLCTTQLASTDAPKYRAWSFNVHGRWYPRKLSLDGQRQSASVYIGEFIGYHERRITSPIYYGGCPACDVPPRADSAVFTQPADTSLVYPPYPYPYPGGSFTQKLHGWEPGAEFGVRVMPARHVVIDVGGTLRVATLQDPQSGTRPGGLVKQLMVAVGVGW